MTKVRPRSLLQVVLMGFVLVLMPLGGMIWHDSQALEHLSQLTSDDNYAAYLAQRDNIPLERISTAYRHILTQAVGVEKELVPEIRTIDMEPEDLLLICSDGLTAALGDEEIGALMGRSRPELVLMTDSLVVAANASGGPDNISVVIVEPLPPLRTDEGH